MVLIGLEGRNGAAATRPGRERGRWCTTCFFLGDAHCGGAPSRESLAATAAVVLREPPQGAKEGVTVYVRLARSPLLAAPPRRPTSGSLVLPPRLCLDRCAE